MKSTLGIPPSKLKALKTASTGHYTAIAAKVGVSKMTVSRVLNGVPGPNAIEVIKAAIMVRDRKKAKSKKAIRLVLKKI